MLVKENYAKAFKEAYVILNNLDENEFSMIPKDFMQLLRKNMDDNYSFEFYENGSLENIEILRETKAVLAYVYMNYISSFEEYEKFNSMFREDIKKFENSKIGAENLFKVTKEINFENQENIVDNKNNTQNMLKEYKKENLLQKILNKIRKILNFK